MEYKLRYLQTLVLIQANIKKKIGKDAFLIIYNYLLYQKTIPANNIMKPIFNGKKSFNVKKKRIKCIVDLSDTDFVVEYGNKISLYGNYIVYHNILNKYFHFNDFHIDCEYFIPLFQILESKFSPKFLINVLEENNSWDLSSFKVPDISLKLQIYLMSI